MIAEQQTQSETNRKGPNSKILKSSAPESPQKQQLRTNTTLVDRELQGKRPV